MLGVLLRAVRTRLRHESPGAGPNAQLGAISFLHRFGSSLNPHFHFHVVVLDGVSTEIDDGVRFDEATHFADDDARALTPILQRRILRLFFRRGLLEEHTVDDMLTWQGTGGFSVDASVRIHGSDRAGRERLLRYCARPPFALDRLRIEGQPGTGSGDTGVRRVLYQPARPTPDGRTLLARSPIEFLDALSRLIPPPRVHRHRYHGGLAPNARLRPDAVALGRVAEAPTDQAPGQGTGALAPEAFPTALTGAAARSRWAQLLARIYEAFPLR